MTDENTREPTLYASRYEALPDANDQALRSEHRFNLDSGRYPLTLIQTRCRVHNITARVYDDDLRLVGTVSNTGVWAPWKRA